MQTIAVINQKGGVAKTTTASAVGAGLYRKGYSVLYIDLDSQGNLTTSTGATPTPPGTMELLQGATVTPTRTPQGDVIPASPALAIADTVITQIGKEYRLKEALSRLKYDFAILDTPPALGILTVNALTAADAAVIPAKADIFSLQGIGQLSQTIAAVKQYTNPELRIAGIVLTMYNRRTVLNREVGEILKDAADQLGTTVFNAKIRPCNALAEAQARRRDIFTYSPKSNAAADYEALVKEILERS